MSEKDDDKQFEAAAVEQEAAGRGGLSQDELDELVASSDTGGRSPGPTANRIILTVALAWSLFQLWIASPIPFMVGFGVFNDTEARSIHLAFAVCSSRSCRLSRGRATPSVQLVLGVGVPVLLLTVAVHDRRKGGRVDLVDPDRRRRRWSRCHPSRLAQGPHTAMGMGHRAFAVLPGSAALSVHLLPIRHLGSCRGTDHAGLSSIAVLGLMLLLEATRRSLGPALMIVAIGVPDPTPFSARFMPEIIAHKGNSLV